MEREQKKIEDELEKINEEISDTKKKTNSFLVQNKSVVGFTSLTQLENKLEKLLSDLHDTSE